MSDPVESTVEQDDDGRINEVKLIEAFEALGFTIMGDDATAISNLLSHLMDGTITLNKSTAVCALLPEIEKYPNCRDELAEYIARKVVPIDGFIEAIRVAQVHAVIGGVDFI